jgi:hypothetical protein
VARDICPLKRPYCGNSCCGEGAGPGERAREMGGSLGPNCEGCNNILSLCVLVIVFLRGGGFCNEVGWLCEDLVCAKAMLTREVSHRVDLLPASWALTRGHREKGNTVYLC